jgi:hypothetical protein
VKKNNAVVAATVLACALAPSFGEQPDIPVRRIGGPPNSPPVCIVDMPFSVECQGAVTIVAIDGSASYDPDGDPLSFTWQVSPNATVDDNHSPTPLITIDTSGSCDTAIGIRLRLGDGQNISFCRLFVSVYSTPEELVLDLDIKPGSCPNPVNTGAGGLVPISLLGTKNFDVSEVNLATLRLGRVDGVGMTIAPTSQISFEDTGTPFADDGCDCHDLTGDGIVDLSLKFAKEPMVTAFQLALEPRFSYLPLELTGELMDGTPFVAYDCIRVQ